MRAISLHRFNALAGYCRDPMARIIGEELGWYEEGGETVLGFVVRDRSDGDFVGHVLGRDEKGRFRWIGDGGFHTTQYVAERELARALRSKASVAEGHTQGDERGKIVDFFVPVVSRDRLNESFIALSELEGYSPAKGIIEPMMHWYEDHDGNFVEQFQTTGFDARLWELYLFAVFVEMGFRIGRIHAVPDFVCGGPFGEFSVEATTINPTEERGGAKVPSATPETLDERAAYLNEYMPIKYGSALTSKLGRRYWEKPAVAGKPFVLALMDFSSPGSMVETMASLGRYLYGYEYSHRKDRRGKLRIIPAKVKEHRWGRKTIPSGFFNLPGAKNVSAVVFSNSGTISKFVRMGILAGFGSKRIEVIRTGAVFDPDPDATEPRQFAVEVAGGDYAETWTDGLSIYHNPTARLPIPPEWFPGAAHHRLLPGGRRSDWVPEGHVIASHTLIREPDSEQGSELG